MNLNYTKQESAEIAEAYAKFEDWANRHSIVEYVYTAFESERKQFNGPARNTQARASILRVAYDAMFNENEPVKPSTIFIRAPLTMIYLAISFRIAGWQGRSNYGDKLEALAAVRDVVHAGVQAHDVAWDGYWRTQLKALDTPQGIEGAL